jgi:hypothetical protein
MEHVRPHFDLDIAAGGPHLLGHSHRIVAQHIVASDQDERRWQAQLIAVERRRIGMAWIGAGKILLRSSSQQ